MNDGWIRRAFRAMASDRGRRFLHAYQDLLLRREIAHAAVNSHFYRQKFAELAVDAHSIRGAADLPRLGFFTYPSDLQADADRFLAVPRRDVVHVMYSSGTTGDPKIVYFSRSDWMGLLRIVGNSLTLMGVTADDVAQVLFCYGSPSWPTGSVTQGGLERLGAFIVPMGNSAPTSKQIEAMRRFGTTVLFGTPSYLHRLTEEGGQLCNLRSLGVRSIYLGAEPWSEGLRALLRNAWRAEVHDTYGMVELGTLGAGECRATSGLHLNPYLLVEIVDPQTGQPLPRGELGEVVFTTLERKATPLLRYRSGDLARLLPDEMCPCGELATDRISRIAGRVDDMIFLGTGENLFPAQFEAALLEVEGLTGFQIVVDQIGFRDQLRIRAETSSPSDGLREAVCQALYRGIYFLHHEIYESQTVLPLEVEFLAPGTLQAGSPIKLRRVVDRRDRNGS